MEQNPKEKYSVFTCEPKERETEYEQPSHPNNQINIHKTTDKSKQMHDDTLDKGKEKQNEINTK